MKVNFKYDDFLANLLTVANVLNESTVSEDIKNVIIQVDGNDVTVMGVTSLLVYKKKVGADAVTVIREDGDKDSEYLSVKIKELIDFLNTYKSLRKTVVDEVILETVRNTESKNIIRIRCTVVEKTIPVDEFDEPKTSISHWMFNAVPVKPNMLPFINMQVPEGITQINLSKYSIHTKQLANILQPGAGIHSSLHFTKDWVYAKGNAFSTYMRNQTTEETEVFTDVDLAYRTVNFIERIASNSTSEDTIGVAKDDKFIFFVTNKDEVIYTAYTVTRDTTYAGCIEAFTKDNCILVNRFSLREALKRFSLKNDSINVTIKLSDGVVEMKNSMFDQQLAILNQKGFEGLDEVHFSIMPNILGSGIICDDISEQAGSEELCLYYCTTSKGINILCLSDLLKYDSDNLWFTYMNTKFN